MSVQSEGSESTISWNVSASGMIRSAGYMATPRFPTDPEDPLAPARGQSLDGLLRLLEQLDGAEEAAVVRSALAAGVSHERVLDELQREVERRLARVREDPSSYPR